MGGWVVGSVLGKVVEWEGSGWLNPDHKGQVTPLTPNQHTHAHAEKFNRMCHGR